MNLKGGEQIDNLNGVAVAGEDPELPNGPTLQRASVLGPQRREARLLPVAEIPHLHNLGLQPYQRPQPEGRRITVEIIQDLHVGREARVGPIFPRVVRELVVGSRRLQPRRPIGAVLPDAANGVGGFEHHRLERQQLLRRCQAADATSDNGYSRLQILLHDRFPSTAVLTMYYSSNWRKKMGREEEEGCEWEDI